jgi:hypothetical protein
MKILANVRSYVATLVLVFLAACQLTSSETGSFANARQTSILANTEIERPLSHSGSYGFALVEGFTRRGDLAQRFEIRDGDCGRVEGYSDCATDRGRIERKERPKNVFSTPDEGVWYGYSIFIPSDFVSLGDANTHLSQAKVEGEDFPIWQLTFNDRPYLLYSDGQTCDIGSLQMWRGGWNDVTVYAHYGEGGEQVYFQLFRNGSLICERRTPIMHEGMWGRPQRIGFKYGIYNSSLSRYDGPLPTHVIYYDEMLVGPTRADVDVRKREQQGLPPVD